jgi:hypothetical protein
MTVNRRTGGLEGVRRTGKREQSKDRSEDQLVFE